MGLTFRWTFWVMIGGALMVLGEAQRSSYAPRPGSNSKLLPKFRKNQTVTEDELAARKTEEFDSPSSSPLPIELRETLEDQKLIDRVSQWPENRQPFWYKNRHALSSARNQESDGSNVEGLSSSARGRPVSRFRSPFFGSDKTRTSIATAFDLHEDSNERRQLDFLSVP